MYRPSAILELINQAETGNIPPEGDLSEVDEVLGFSFGLHFNPEGYLAQPGSTNEAIAKMIVSDEVLRSKYMTLQEELAIAVEAREPHLANQINAIPTIKSPFQTYNTHDILQAARPGLIERNVGLVAVVAFRNHLPRANAHVRKAGFSTALPDMRAVGDFDPSSGQAWIRNPEDWIKRERLAIGLFAALNRI